MQQPLERYGVVVLLFLVALVAVAVFWEDGTSTHTANETLATVEPLDERALVDQPERRPAPDTSRATANRPAPEIAVEPEDLGIDQRGRTTNYADNRVVGGPTAPVDDVQPETDGEGFSRAEQRGGGDTTERDTAGVNADLPAAPPVGRDSLAKDLERAGAGTKGTPVVPVTPPADGAREYTVRSGESLWRIAERELGNGARCNEIAKLNGLGNSDLIKEGMKLRLPPKDGAQPVEPTLPKAGPAGAAPNRPAPPAGQPVKRGTGDTTERLASVSGTRRYVVKSGDSLGLIAQRELGSAKRGGDIKQLNGMSSDVVKLGTTLLLPADGIGNDDSALAAATPKTEARRDTTRPAAGKDRPATNREFYVR